MTARRCPPRISRRTRASLRRAGKVIAGALVVALPQILTGVQLPAWASTALLAAALGLEKAYGWTPDPS